MSSSSLVATTSSQSDHDGSRIRATKRKLDDAFEILDNAVLSSNSPDRPLPPKRSNTTRSLYSTLAKYGIRSKETRTQVASTADALENLTKNTPHLAAILSRAASRTKNSFPFKFTSQAPSSQANALPATAEYRPSSLPSFLSRLATFKLSTYANKPPSIDAVAAAKCGWINDGKDRLVCGLCNASWVVVGRDNMNRDAANSLIEKQRISLVESHKNGCPWKTRQCDPTIYCIPLKAPSSMAREIRSTAEILNLIVSGIAIKHPLTSTQLQSLRQAVETSSLLEDSTCHNASLSPDLSDAAILISLFGWTLVPPAPHFSRRASSQTTSQVGSRSSTPALPATPSTPNRSRPLKFQLPLTMLSKQVNNTLLQCTFCQRRIGLWAFTPQEFNDSSSSQLRTNGTTQSSPTPELRQARVTPNRQFDLLKEHRSYCPYVVRSTVVPSFVTTSSGVTPARKSSVDSSAWSNRSGTQEQNGHTGALEGWRAVLTVILRHGMAQRQNLEHLLRTNTIVSSEESGDQMDVDNVKAMITGVKNRGGRDLLKYVKSLLG